MPLQLYKIALTELSTAASTITFSSIPQGYTDLKVVVSARTTRTSNSQDWVKISFNGVTTNLSERTLYGDGSTTGSYTDTLVYGGTTSDAATANTFGSTEFYIPNYAGNTNKSISVDGVSENNATLVTTTLTAGLWSSTAAITSITLAPYTGPNFVANTTATLYGIL
jgi:hypothetical protein